MRPPLVSIVMPTRNQAEFISSSIDSVLGQDYENLELIIADGNSQDKTLSLLREYSAKDKRIRWFSEKDSGPASALNKAISTVRGTIVGWLNSDDIYTNGSVNRAIQKLETEKNLLMVYGESQNISIDTASVSRYPTLPPKTQIQDFKNGCFISQPTVFFRRSMYVLLGPLDESLETAFDFDYWMRAFKKFSNRIGFIENIQALCRIHAASITANRRREVLLEGIKIINNSLNISPKDWVITYFSDIQNRNDLTLAEKYNEAQDFLSHAIKNMSPADTKYLKLKIDSVFSKKME